MWYFLLYTGGFLAAAILMLLIFRKENASFTKMADGVAQHYAVLMWIRNTLRQFLHGNFALPMVDFSVGQGFDVIGTLNYYGVGDPVNLLTVFFADNHLDQMYMFLILFRMYLSGLTFSYYCSTAGIQEKPLYCVVPGCMYFCSFALIGGMKHPLFFKWYAVSAAAACRNGESPAKEKHPLFKRIGGTCLYEQLLFHVHEHHTVRHLSVCTAFRTLSGIRDQKDPTADLKNGGGVDLGHMPWSSDHSAVRLCLSSQCKSGHCGGRGTELLQHCTLPENDPRIFPDTSDDERLDSTWNGDRRSGRCADALYVKKKESGKLPAEDRICRAACVALYSVWRKK